MEGNLTTSHKKNELHKEISFNKTKTKCSLVSDTFSALTYESVWIPPMRVKLLLSLTLSLSSAGSFYTGRI
jgi:hypothetical protein